MTPDEMAALHAGSIAVPRPWTSAEFRQQISQTGTFALTQSGGLLVGRTIADEAELLTLAVAPDRRRGGIGKTLVCGFLEEARKRRASRAFLEVATGNVGARALYAACQFTDAGTRRAYYRRPDGTREDAIVMTRDL